MIKWTRRVRIRPSQATKRSIRRVVSILNYFELRIHPPETNERRGIYANGPGSPSRRGGCAAGHVPPSPILIRVHTSFRGMAAQCLSCVKINHCAVAVHQIALWSLATILMREPRRVRISLGIIDLLASRFVYDRDMPDGTGDGGK